MTSTTSIGVKHPVIHFEIMGRDPAALSKFYGDVFGWAIKPPMAGDPMEYNTVDTVPEDDNVISGGIGKAREGYEGHVTFYIRVDDVEAALNKIEARGGSRMMGPDNVPMPNGASITIGLFHDPEGRTIGLVDPGDAM
jgi:predicted enzyme related to lactoylglutathione lyase